MENPITRRIYDAAPVLAQELFASSYGVWKNRSRYGPFYRKWHDFFSASLSWPADRLRSYQLDCLRRTLTMAERLVPFYRERFRAAGVRAENVTTLDELKAVPVLERAELRDAGSAILAEGAQGSEVLSGATGGSTGGRLLLYWSPEAHERMFGFFWARDRVGFERGTPYASFGCQVIAPPGQKRPPFWRRNFAANQLLFSVFHLGERTADAYLDRLAEGDHAYYEGYPTPMFILARRLLEKPRPFRRWPTAVFCTGEELQPGYRQTIESAFHTRVFNQYGQGERVCCITEYPCGHLHYDLDFGLAEFLPTGIRTADGREVLEVVATGFFNDVAPLIRYRIGDLVVLEEGGAAGCQYHAGPIVREVYGRTGQVLVGKSGTLFHNVTSIARRTKNVAALQCVQDTAGEMVVNVIPLGEWSKRDEETLAGLIRSRMGDEIEFTVTVVDAIPKTPAGKTLTIVSRARRQG